MINSKVFAAFACLTLAWSGPAMAGMPPSTPVVFVNNPDSQAFSIVKQVYGNYIGAQPDGGQIQVALIDLDHDGNAAIGVRFVDPNSCNSQAACHTTILAMENGGWKEVFSQRVTSLSIEDGAKGYPAWLISDGHVIWQVVRAQNGEGFAYYPQLATYTGTTWFQPYLAATQTQIAAADAAMFPKGPPSGDQPSDYRVAPLNVGGALGTAYEIMDSNTNQCGEIGCPVAIVDQNGVSVLNEISNGRITILNSSTDGVKDLALADFFGLATYHWDSNSLIYREAATSYSSQATPIP